MEISRRMRRFLDALFRGENNHDGEFFCFKAHWRG